MQNIMRQNKNKLSEERNNNLYSLVQTRQEWGAKSNWDKLETNRKIRCCCWVYTSGPALCDPVDHVTPGPSALHRLLASAHIHVCWVYQWWSYPTISSSAPLSFAVNSEQIRENIPSPVSGPNAPVKSQRGLERRKAQLSYVLFTKDAI